MVSSETKKSRKAPESTSLSDATRLADFYRSQLTDNDDASLPLVAYYPVERVVLDIPLKVKTKHSFKQLDGYDNALSQGVDFRRFFEWFREREDAENESGVSPEFLNKLFEKSGSEKNPIWKELQKVQASSRDRQLTAVRHPSLASHQSLYAWLFKSPH